MQNHFAVVDAEYAPTIVIKKTAFTKEDVSRWRDSMKTLPKDLPPGQVLSCHPYSHIRLRQAVSGLIH